MKTLKSGRTRSARAHARVFALASATILGGIGVASAADNGPTQVGSICMQKIFGTPVSNSNRVNCTANDIRLSRAISVSPTSCVRGTTFDLTATFETIVTANARYDAGFFFRIDGGANARDDGVNATGQCSLSALRPPPPLNSPSLDLDGDGSGDLNAGTYNVTFTIPGVACQDSDNDRLLNLPNCTSWHSNQGTLSTLGDASTFKPDTKSKCVCDDTFEVPVRVEDATISVEKTAAPTELNEPGGEVTFTVSITNTSNVEPVRITSIIDVPYGDKGSGVASDDNTCPGLIGTDLDPGETTSCYFKDDVWGNAGETKTDTVTVTALQPSNNATLQDDDTADVTLQNLGSTPTLVKTAQSTANCSVEASYQVVVNNASAVDRLTVNSLTDDKFGSITSVHDNVVSTDCSVPQTIDLLQNYTCSFVGRIASPSCDLTHTNKVVADVTDDDNESSQPEGSATVTLSTTP
jgi:uncharacterized repeat protein (TIGR01451 family)